MGKPTFVVFSAWFNISIYLYSACILLKSIGICMRRVGLFSLPYKRFEGEVAFSDGKVGNHL